VSYLILVGRKLVKRLLFLLIVPILIGGVLIISPTFSAMAKGTEKSCTTIQSKLLKDSTGVTITTGFDQWGYNYQAHMFNGEYCDSYRDAAWCQAYKDVNLSMKWNDGWMSNTDCNKDGLLDRHHGFDSYIGSGAWLTNHQSGVNEDGTTWTYFVKIVAAPADATLIDGTWYMADGTELGYEIWNEFAVVQEISNDSSNDTHGIQYLSEYGPGFGHIK